MDTNWWKSFSASRLALAPGTPGGWEIFGRDPLAHKLLFAHYCAEEPKAAKELAHNLVVEEWKWKPGRPDNHWWDNLIGSRGRRDAGSDDSGYQAPTRTARKSRWPRCGERDRGQKPGSGAVL